MSTSPTRKQPTPTTTRSYGKLIRRPWRDWQPGVVPRSSPDRTEGDTGEAAVVIPTRGKTTNQGTGPMAVTGARSLPSVPHTYQIGGEEPLAMTFAISVGRRAIGLILVQQKGGKATNVSRIPP